MPSNLQKSSSSDISGHDKPLTQYGLKPGLIDALRSDFEKFVLDALRADLIKHVSITSYGVPTHLRPD